MRTIWWVHTVSLGTYWAINAVGSELPEEGGKWTLVGKTGAFGLGGATVYAPPRQQVIRWGGTWHSGTGRASNGVLAFDFSKREWVPDYEPVESNVGGNFYGGQAHAAWLTAREQPGCFFIFRLACWDSKRNRMVIAAHNLTAAYDPVIRSWNDLKAAFETADGKRIEGCAPKRYGGAWFAPVPGQWGSMCYDAHNDEYVIFPLWITRASRSPNELVRPELSEDGGVRAGHYGTLIFDPRANVWKVLELGSDSMRAARERLSQLINMQREAARVVWKAMLDARLGHESAALAAMVEARTLQKQVHDAIADEKSKLESIGKQSATDDAIQFITTVTNLVNGLRRVQATLRLMNQYDAGTLSRINGQQRAVYRLLRLVHDRDLYVQPTRCCSA